MEIKKEGLLFLIIGVIILAALVLNINISGEQTKNIQLGKEYKILPTYVYYLDGGNAHIELYDVEEDGTALIRIGSEFVEIRLYKEKMVGGLKILNLEANYDKNIENSWVVIEVTEKGSNVFVEMGKKITALALVGALGNI